MDEDADYVAAHPDLAGLPISQVMMKRLEQVTNSDGVVSADDAIAPIIAAIVALERELRMT